jgi:N-acyl-D-aspartate/D-glutamate deacylase
MTADLLLSGGLLVDGSGAPPRAGDLLIGGDTVIAVLGPATSPGFFGDVRRVDCRGLVVAPGFIDLHTHSDLTRLRYPDAQTRVYQGVTTEVIGNCGMSPFPVTQDTGRLRSVIDTIDVCPDVDIDWDDAAGYFRRLGRSPAATNVVALVGHGVLRELVAEQGHDPATQEAWALMREHLRSAFASGVAGLSLGLMYPPGELATHQELSELAAEVAAADALLAVHLRSYAADSLADSVRELITAAGPHGTRVQLSHLRSLRDVDARGIAAALAVLDDAPERFEADLYPYLAGHTTALQLFPPRLRARGVAAVTAAAEADPAGLVAALHDHIGDPSRVMVAKAARRSVVGLDLRQAAQPTGVDWAQLLLDVFLEAGGRVDVIVAGSTDQDMMAALRHPRVSIASDGVALDLGHTANVPHPRSIGTFPRALRRLLEDGLPLQSAVYKATGQPARRLGLTDRGIVRAGGRADLVVFDPSELDDRAGYTTPLIPPTGIHTVVVNGTLVLADGVPTGARPGRLLRAGRAGR